MAWSGVSNVESTYLAIHEEYQAKLDILLAENKVPIDTRAKISKEFKLLDFSKRSKWKEVSVLSLIVGLNEGYATFLATIILLLYNVLRGFLTLKVNLIRDIVEHTNTIPEYKSYKVLFHLHKVTSIILYLAIVIAAFNIASILLKPVYIPV